VTRLEAELASARTDADARLAASAAASASGAPPAPDPCGEAEVWATRLVVLQDTLRMHREEAGAAEVELAGRARLAAAAAERAAAEAAGSAAAARLRAQLDATEARLDRLKMELYFPRAKGYSFAVGSKGIYFGGKDLIVSECSGPLSFECSTTAPGAGGGGGGGAPSSGAAVMEMRIGAWAADEAARWAGEADAAAAGGGGGGGAPATRRPQAPPPASPSPLPRPHSAGNLTHGGGPAPANGGDRPLSAGGLAPAATSPPPPPPAAWTPPAPSPLRPATVDGAAPPPTTTTTRASSPDSDGLLEAAAAGSGEDEGGGEAAPAPPLPALPLPPPPLPPSLAAADQVSAPPGAGRGRAMAARFLSRIGSDRQMERYARRAAQPDGPADAWPAAEAEGSVGGGGGGGSARPGAECLAALPPLPPTSRGSKPTLAQRLMRRAASRKEGRAAAAAAAYAAAAGLAPLTTSSHFASSPRLGRLAGLGGMRRARSAASLASADSPDGRAGAGGAGHGVGGGGGGGPLPTPAPMHSLGLSDAQADVDAAAGGDADLGDLPPAASMLDLAVTATSLAGAAPAAAPPPSLGQPVLGPSDEEEDEDGGEGRGRGGRAATPRDWGHLGAGPVDAAGIGADAPQAPRARKEGRPPAGGPPSAAGGSSGGGGAHPHPSRAPSRRGLLVVLRVTDVALVGERGSKCPSLSVAELTVEFELHGRLGARWDGRTGAWEPHGRCAIEVARVSRSVRGASVPVPKALLRLIVSAVLPPVFQRLLTGALPPELGEYIAEAGRAGGVGVRMGGEVAIVGPALSALDARLATPPPGTAPAPGDPPPKDAASAARAASAAAEARAALRLTPGQAGLVEALLASPATALTGDPRPATLAVLASLHKRYARHPALWIGACAVWDTALRALAAGRGVPPPPTPFSELAAGAAAGLARKPVRVLLTLTHADVGACVDAAISSLRTYFERQARELAVQGGGRGATQATATAGTTRPPPPPPPSLDAALSALEAWHAYVQSQLRSFKATFRGASARLVASADARGASVGAEAARYVGPLHIRVPISAPAPAAAACGGSSALAAAAAADPDAFSFTVPLPDPASTTVRRFVEAARSAVASPPARPRGVAPGVTRALPSGSALFSEPALGWFVEDAAAAAPGAPHVPASLGTLAVDGLRARVRLDEAALAELLGVGGPSGAASGPRDPASAVRLAQTAAGVLAALGDVARVSFAPAAAGPPGSGGGGAGPGFVLAIESAAASALHADVAGLAFSTAEGVTPARLTRLAHALARAALLALAGGNAAAAGEAVAALDARFDAAAEHVGRDALELALCVDARAAVVRPPGAGPGTHGPLTLRVTGVPAGVGGEEGDLPPPPLVAGNDVDLSALFAGVRAPPSVPGADV